MDFTKTVPIFQGLNSFHINFKNKIDTDNKCDVSMIYQNNIKAIKSKQVS